MKVSTGSQTTARTRRCLDKTESFVILEEPAERTSYHSVFDGGEEDSTDPRNTNDGNASPESFAIDVSIQRGRLAILTVVVVGVIVALVRFFQQGYEIRRYTTKLDSGEQKRLLDDYNSFSGNIVSSFGKPIELFVTACVQVVLLRLVSASMLRNHQRWKAVYSALAVSAGVSYLINNGFNSLNVQLIDLELQPAVDASDLYADEVAISSFSSWRYRVTNVSHSVSENQPSNPVTNTVLRNLVQSRAERAKTVCEQIGGGIVRKPLQMDTVEYGFPQRDWMKKLLPEARPGTTMSLVINATTGNMSINSGLKVEDLPMNASIAAELMIYSVLMSTEVLPLPLRTPVFDFSTRGSHNTSAAIRLGFLPPDSSASDDLQKKWFLNRLGGFFSRWVDFYPVTDITSIPMNFTHVDITPDISFDSLTIEIDMVPWLQQEYNNSKTGDRFMNGVVNLTTWKYEPTIPVPSFNCDPWPGRCVFRKRDPFVNSSIDNSELYMDTPSQIQAFSICLNDNGTEWIQSSRVGSKLDNFINVVPCKATSDSSMLLIGLGKRLTAEALTQNTTADASGIRRGGVGTATNVRKLYSLTVGRLSWKTTDIASAFGAKCNVATGSKCEGLTIPLNKTAQDVMSQQLVVSADKLPIGALLPPQLNNIKMYNMYKVVRQRPLVLVHVYEPTRQDSVSKELWYDIVAGDILHPHNVRNLTWDLMMKRPGDMCEFEEERVQRVLDNHRYIEHPLQATYTAAVFFLFQNAVVRDRVDGSTRITTLGFDGNKQVTALVASIPVTNSRYTQVGCLVLVLGVTASIIWATIIRSSSHRPDLLTGITNAEVMARAKLDDRSFPQFLLHRKVALISGSYVDRRELDKFAINSLTLQEEKEDVDMEDKRSDSTSMEDGDLKGSIAV